MTEFMVFIREPGKHENNNIQRVALIPCTECHLDTERVNVKRAVS